MRITPLASFLALASLAACGGGGGGGGSTSGLLKGNVVSVNGSSSNVSGVVVKALSTNAQTTTNSAGGFTLPNLPAGLQGVTFKTSNGSEQEVEFEIEDGGELRVSVRVNDDSLDDIDEDHCGGSTRTEARAPLVSALGHRGYVRVRREADGDQGFDVEAEGLTPGQVVAMVVIDPSDDSEDLIGTVTATGIEGEAEVELRSSDGEQMPFNMGSVIGLAGFRVEVRVGSQVGAVMMEGVVPAPGTLPACSGEDDDDDDGNGVDDDTQESEGASVLSAVNGALGQARAELESSGSSWKLEVEVENSSLVGTLPLQVYVDLGAGYVLFGTMLAGDDAGEYEYELEDEDTLPTGLSSVGQLWQAPIQVRNSDGTPVAKFTGNLPVERAVW
ncbi:MAG: hypothetical protein ACKOCB_05380 [Planctomycetia bacterium]